MSRSVEVERITKETSIKIKLELDGKGEAKLDYPIGFFAHMLNTFASHGLFNLEIKASGDLEVDQHHLIEDTGIVLGQCFAKALGEKKGIRRVGSCYFPMDECLTRAVVDISGRPYLFFESPLDLDTTEDFWQGFVSSSSFAMHLDVIRGRSIHHVNEALFKAAGRALKEACSLDPRSEGIIPSTKGVLA